MTAGPEPSFLLNSNELLEFRRTLCYLRIKG
jgi:hypothetical protein